MKIHRCRSISTGLLLCLAAAAWTDSLSAETQVPDLSGFYDSSSLTPLNRAREFGEKRFMTLAEAEAIMADAAARYAKDAQPSDPERGAPAIGGAAPTFADDDQRETLGAGNVGGL